ncbi:hypothetical protein [Rhodovulum euryhalinum]|uniref:Uncharacterized protein n=1 Tax=Rhodovulum euryhalinum TaxID=35805 RepID=A0A4R2KPT9_9RHOB|nr:hypothetical protein [Rhodovulum euryhalinum]TCO72879.1 hypothetical protein EV655_103108 [Rhodovulum euryhalinum]
MITLDDIEDMTDLTRAEIAAIAEHEHIPEADATLLADYLMHAHHGAQKVQAMICEDIREALHADDLPHARALYAVLHRFVSDHPESVRGSEG